MIQSVVTYVQTKYVNHYLARRVEDQGDQTFFYVVVLFKASKEIYFSKYNWNVHELDLGSYYDYTL
jgi:hypothetical protein